MKYIVTIGREFGAGGGEIGRKVSSALRIPFYDKEVILHAAEEAHVSASTANTYDERLPTTFGFAQSLFDFYGRPLSERLFEAQTNVIRRLADKESCVIVGRNADYILKEFDHCLSVFIHANFNWRMQRMSKLVDDPTPSKLKANMMRVDKARKSYYEYLTRRTYGAADNYDLTLCSNKLGIDTCVDLIVQAAKVL